MPAELGFKKGLPDFAAYRRGKALKVFSAGSHEYRGLDCAKQILTIVIYL
jgi:hypothetical protein